MKAYRFENAINYCMIILLLFVFVLLIILAGCANTSVEKVSEEPEPTSRFVVVEETGNWEIVADKETGVMYSVSVGGYNSGDFTLLVDENGNPLILESMDEVSE